MNSSKHIQDDQKITNADRLRRILEQPPKEFSPAPIWWWSGDPLEIERLRWQMDRFVEGGVYNLVLLNLAPTGPLYGSDPDEPRFFSEEWWEIFIAVCEYAEKIGLSIWFYDQIGFSGANLQGEIVRENPEYAGCWLESIHVEGEGSLEVTCPFNGEPLTAGAVSIDENGQAIGEVVPVAIVDGKASFSGQGRHRLRMSYVIRRGFDYFNPAACVRLLQIIHGEYEKRAAPYFGKSIVGSFQDELPSLSSWSPDFLTRFEKRFGYAIEPHLIALWEQDDESTRRVRVDYHALRAEMAEEAIFKPMFEWHEKHGLICGFDQQSPSRAGEPKATVRQYADYIATHRWYQAPGSDHHGEAKIHSSMAHLYDRKRVWIESFHTSGWGGTIEETLDWLLPWIRAGATLYNPHAVYYSTRGGWWEWAPPSTCWRQPYWRHYSHMAEAVSRLCALLSEGDHVCDIGLLYPTTTIQSGMTPDGPIDPFTEIPDGSTDLTNRAHQCYKKLVGVMHWQRPEPGIFDQDRRDYDILDDASIQRATVSDGTLTIGAEHFKVVVLPDCTVLQASTARVLLDFVRAGGKVIAIGSLPLQVLGKGGDQLLDDIREAGREGLIKLVDEPGDLPRALADHPRIVDAPVPTLLRRVGDAHVLFVPAAFPYATVHHNHHTQVVRYDFDPQTYARSMKVTAQGVQGQPQLWDVLTGERTPLAAKMTPDGMEVEVPFETGPMALVVWPGEGEDLPPQVVADKTLVHEFPNQWEATVKPTMDNRFGDFSKPDLNGPFPVETWYFWHSKASNGDDPRSVRGLPSEDDGWSKVHATFGVYGLFAGPGPLETLPALGTAFQDRLDRPENWRETTYSLERGIAKDPLHFWTLGPKGHVPEEFLQFGEVKRGEGVQFCTRVWIDESTLADHEKLYLAIGAPAAKEVFVNGQRVDAEDNGYLAMIPVSLKSGKNTLEWRLVADADNHNLRSYWALIKDPEAFARPEWITSSDLPKRDSTLRFTAKVELPFHPVSGTIQLGADAPGRVLVNGVEQGRQGGFDPYNVTDRVQPYDLTDMKAGENEIVVEIQDIGRPAAILVDALVQGPDGERTVIISGEHWMVGRDDNPQVPVALRRRQWIDPAWSHLWRRPHPLPGAMWIEDEPPTNDVLLVIPDATQDEDRIEWFKWTLPPGANKITIPVQGDVRLWVNGAEVSLEKRVTHGNGMASLAGPDSSAGPEGPVVSTAQSGVYVADLPDPEGLHRVATLKVIPEQGRTGGGVFTAPVTYETISGTIQTGDWADQGLESYSGSLRYESAFELTDADGEGSFILDLGRVRGTAEVRINGTQVGARVWSPYQFDVTTAVKPGINQIEILVCNTLGPYLKAASPTAYVFKGQELSGMYGPVKLFRR